MSLLQGHWRGRCLWVLHTVGQPSEVPTVQSDNPWVLFHAQLGIHIGVRKILGICAQAHASASLSARASPRHAHGRERQGVSSLGLAQERHSRDTGRVAGPHTGVVGHVLRAPVR
jgi:hypothetical protein